MKWILIRNAVALGNNSWAWKIKLVNDKLLQDNKYL
jgi:hypothetical protein